jgi:hypothetical protein
MNVKEILEAKYIGHSKWDMFKSEFLSYAGREQEKQIVKSGQVKSLFNELLLSFDFWHGITISHIDDMPEEYDKWDRDPGQIASHWFDSFITNPGILDDELSSYRPLSKEIPSKHLGIIVRAMGGWIKYNADELVELANE